MWNKRIVSSLSRICVQQGMVMITIGRFSKVPPNPAFFPLALPYYQRVYDLYSYMKLSATAMMLYTVVWIGKQEGHACD